MDCASCGQPVGHCLEGIIRLAWNCPFTVLPAQTQLVFASFSGPSWQRSLDSGMAEVSSAPFSSPSLLSFTSFFSPFFLHVFQGGWRSDGARCFHAAPCRGGVQEKALPSRVLC